MKAELWMIGKTADRYLEDGMAIYEKRLKHYLPFEVVLFSDVKNAKSLSQAQLKEAEGQLFLQKLDPRDHLILLDERGKQDDSVSFAKWMEQTLSQGHKRLIFLIGGAYGFSEAVYRRANGQRSLSKMTFSHQMVRLIMLEQVYRAMTILRGEPYHHA